MADYTGNALRALNTLTRKGTAVTFTLASPGTYAPTTDTFATPVTSTVAGYAVRLPGDPERYAALGLRINEAATLLFAPSTTGQTPSLGSKTSFAGETFTVEDVDPVEPAGTAIVCKVVCKR